ncbi:MAG: hypothetical protein WCW35_11870 [Bacteroidota bacterium]|jgi:hypothetical protein
MSIVRNKNISTILSNESGFCIELLHNACDPMIWIIRRSKKFLWFRLHRSNSYFYDKQNALLFARKQLDFHRA